MKYFQQILIIILISFLGELLNYTIPLPIPANIYGFILMFILLCSGIVKVDQIKEAGKFLLDIMPMLFIPSAVGIMSNFEILSEIWIEIIVITLITTVLVMVVSGRVTQYFLLRKKRAKNDDSIRN